MADLSDVNSSGISRIVGSNSIGVETTPVAASNQGELTVVDGLSNGGVYGNLNLVTAGVAYEAKVGVSALSGRKSLTITALDDMYWGYDSSVTTSNGIPLFKNQTLVFSINPNSSFKIYLVASGNNKNARIAESI